MDYFSLNIILLFILGGKTNHKRILLYYFLVLFIVFIKNTVNFVFES